VLAANELLWLGNAFVFKRPFAPKGTPAAPFGFPTAVRDLVHFNGDLVD
jgi:hypothetical protein